MIDGVRLPPVAEASQRVPQGRETTSVNPAEMTGYAEGYAAGVASVLDIARASAAAIRAKPWKPTREGAADALEALAEGYLVDLKRRKIA